MVCPSCSTKRSILFAEKVREIVKPVPHLHITFTIPKILRAYFRRNRKLLKLLVQSANYSIVIAEIFRARLLTVLLEHPLSPYESLVFYYGAYSSSLESERDS